MKKSDFIAIFKKHSTENFVISTNSPVGHGINGVSYTSFVGAWEKEPERKSPYGPKLYYEYNQIVGFVGDCVVIEQDKHCEDEQWKNGKREFYIPLESVVSVSIMKSGARAFRGTYPASVKKCVLTDI